MRAIKKIIPGILLLTLIFVNMKITKPSNYSLPSNDYRNLPFVQQALSSALSQSQPQDSSSASPSAQPLVSPTSQPLVSPVSTALGQIGQNSADIVGLVQKYFPKNQWVNALKIMQLESGGSPQAVGDNHIIPHDISEQLGHPIPSYGLFQIRALPGRPDPQQLANPEFNVQYAANLFKQSGWSPWKNSATKLGLL